MRAQMVNYSFFFFSSRRRHTRCSRDWSSDVCSSDLFEGAVCRPMKVGKEEVIGCLTAIETWLKTDPKKLDSEWNARVERIAKLVETVPGVSTEIYIPDDGNRYPTLRVSWEIGRAHV